MRPPYRQSVKHRRLALLALFLLSTALLTAGGTPARAAADSAPPTPASDRVGWLRVPVFFATERPLNVSAAALDYVDERSDHGLGYGVKYQPVPLYAGANTKLEELAPIGFYKMLGNSDLGPATLAVPSEQQRYATRTYRQDELFSLLKETIENSPRKELIFFVHGCCADYAISCQRAATIAEWFRAPVLMYDWASPVGIGTYLKNEAAVDQSRDGFLEFFDAVLAKLPAAKITIIGHSMGNRFVDAALVRLHDKASALDSPVKLDEVIFAAADVDARAYANHCDKTATMANVTRLYISDSDFALFSSDKAIHRYPRVGAPGALLKLLCKTPAQEVINATRLDIGHNMPFWLMADMHSLGKPAAVPAYNLKKVSEHYYVLTGGPKP